MNREQTIDANELVQMVAELTAALYSLAVTLSNDRLRTPFQRAVWDEWAKRLGRQMERLNHAIEAHAEGRR